ncbi:MAG: hypothetical protein FGM33_02610, partial [Candidatus Kapabacteria bacterium]|nr:hypothetical protein [Candidatus Kapabacteria bacterium]
MSSKIISIGAVVMIIMTAAFVVSAQTYLGPVIGTVVTTSSRADVSSYGTPSRYFYGGRLVMPVRRGTELAITLGLRQEEGGFLSAFTKNSIGGNRGIVDVVENPISGPSVVSSLSTSSVELNASLRIPLARFDTAGSYLGVHLGAMADMLTSADQVDDYTRILQGDRGQIPDRVQTTYDSQIGGGAVLGALMVLKTDIGRLVIEMSYILRQPETLAIPSPRIGGAKEQYVGWLVGNGLRLSAGLELGL